MTRRRVAVTVTGMVQGVGFRPFLHRLAAAHGLTGWARNTPDGVALELEGEPAELDAFVQELRKDAPPLALVDEVRTDLLGTARGEKEFVILPSTGGVPRTLITPDTAPCPACLAELHNPADRRYHYPFINCTDCGPRFTILNAVPYDRKNTTMASFSLCPDCAAEYGDITSRRYHAQPDCCADCGPRLWFADKDGAECPDDGLAAARALLLDGGILAVKGLGGFHLACLAGSEAAVTELRRRKHRPDKPLALMVPDMNAARALCRISSAEAAALQSPRRPIVLLRKRDPDALPFVSSGPELGLMLPCTPVHELLLEGMPPLIMTSANPSSLPALIDNTEALRALHGIADGFLLNDRDIAARCDDTLLRILPNGAPYFVRRSRGYVPQPVTLDFPVDGILALGAEQKASFTLGREKMAFCSQHIGDLKNAETLTHYETQIARFETLFGVTPQRFVCDLHPDYLSTRYAASRGGAVLAVQHHHAHMAACMADRRLEGACIGLIWDGTGLGDDGTIWGGECLVGDYTSYHRIASIRPVKLLGGDAAIQNIDRIAYALCRDADCVREENPLFDAMLRQNISCPASSGMGRLFDGVYSLLTGTGTVSYDGQAAAALEALADRAAGEEGCYPVTFTDDDSLPRLDTRVLIRALLADPAPAPVRAKRFHNTLVEFALRCCVLAREQTGLCRVVLSGGVFFNQLLLNGITARLTEAGFAVYPHRRVSPGDEGLSLGQLAIAAHS